MRAKFWKILWTAYVRYFFLMGTPDPIEKYLRERMTMSGS
jgi:hypothetical protein